MHTAQCGMESARVSLVETQISQHVFLFFLGGAAVTAGTVSITTAETSDHHQG